MTLKEENQKLFKENVALKIIINNLISDNLSAIGLDKKYDRALRTELIKKCFNVLLEKNEIK